MQHKISMYFISISSEKKRKVFKFNQNFKTFSINFAYNLPKFKSDFYKEFMKFRTVCGNMLEKFVLIDSIMQRSKFCFAFRYSEKYMYGII